jgi:hypothetical protein
LFSRLALGLDLLRSLAFCLCGACIFAILAASRFASLAAFDLAGGFTLRLLRRLALRALRSLDLRFLSGFALCLPRRLAPGFSRSVALRLFGSLTLRSLDGFEPRLLWAAPGAALRSGWRRRLRHDKHMRRLVVPVSAREARCVGLGLGGKRGETIDFSGIKASETDGFRHGPDDVAFHRFVPSCDTTSGRRVRQGVATS